MLITKFKSKDCGLSIRLTDSNVIIKDVEESLAGRWPLVLLFNHKFDFQIELNAAPYNYDFEKFIVKDIEKNIQNGEVNASISTEEFVEEVGAEDLAVRFLDERIIRIGWREFVLEAYQADNDKQTITY